MATSEKKQHIPIFVGSTYTDLMPYRKAVSNALHSLETIVRGMEYFGSKPGSPVDECINVVRSCKIYIGIIGMRYGTIPDGYDRSMTHLEYDEAQRLNLPSLIYIIDEENQPVLPKNVEFGNGADKLKDYKNQLTKKHVVSFFSTENDLEIKVLHDLPPLLKEIGTEIDENSLKQINSITDDELLIKFKMLPARFKDREVSITFNLGELYRTDDETCDALSFSLGDSIHCNSKLNDLDGYVDIYFNGDVAVQILDHNKKSTIQAVALTKFGQKAKDMEVFGGEPYDVSYSGLVVKKIVSVR